MLLMVYRLVTCQSSVIMRMSLFIVYIIIYNILYVNRFLLGFHHPLIRYNKKIPRFIIVFFLFGFYHLLISYNNLSYLLRESGVSHMLHGNDRQADKAALYNACTHKIWYIQHWWPTTITYTTFS